MVTPFAIRLAATGVDDAGPRRRPHLRAVHGRQHHRHLRAGPHHHPADRHAADADRRGADHRRSPPCRCWPAAGSRPGSWSPASSPPCWRCRRRSSRRSRACCTKRSRATSSSRSCSRATERLLYLNEGYAVHSVWRPDTVLTGGEWDMFLTAPPLLGRPAAPRRHRSATPPAPRRAPTASTTRRRASTASSSTRPSRAVGRRWFGLGDNPRLTVHTADARPFLASTDAQLRPHPHRRLSPALRALLPGDARVLPALPAAARARRHRRPQRVHGARRPPPRRGHRRHAARRVPPGRHLAGAALQPVRRGPHGAALAGGHDRPPGWRRRTTSCPTRASSPATCARRRRPRHAVDRRPLPRRVGHRPHDRRLRRSAGGDRRRTSSPPPRPDPDPPPPAPRAALRRASSTCRV